MKINFPIKKEYYPYKTLRKSKLEAKKNILFIVNPISGIGKQKEIAKMLEKYLNLQKFSFEICFTEYRGHAISLSKSGIKKKFDNIVAVGGDGTVNEVASALTNSNVCMGIIPVGSGNGLARHLKIPMQINKAIKVLNKEAVKTIDTASLNGNSFVNVAGIGFDAHIAHLYAQTKKRGAIPYMKFMTSEFYKYKPTNYQVFIDERPYHLSAFLISFANSSQFGNNAYISPHALIDDGLIDICMLKEFPMIESGALAVKLMNKRIDKSKYMTIVKGSSAKIKSQENIKAHIDGEPINLPKEICLEINKASLKIIYNADFFSIIKK